MFGFTSIIIGLNFQILSLRTALKESLDKEKKWSIAFDQMETAAHKDTIILKKAYDTIVKQFNTIEKQKEQIKELQRKEKSEEKEEVSDPQFEMMNSFN